MTLGNPRCIAESENGKKYPKRMEDSPPRFLHATSNFIIRLPKEGIKGKIRYCGRQPQKGLNPH